MCGFYCFLDSFHRKGFLSNVLLAFFKGKESFGYVGVDANYAQVGDNSIKSTFPQPARV